MLPPQKMYHFKILGVPVLRRLNDIPAQVGVFWLILQMVRRGRPTWPRPARWILAILCFGLWFVADIAHAAGHIISGRQVGAPPDAITGQYGLHMLTYYNDDVTMQQHMGRAAGGPVMSLLLAGSGFVVWRIVRRVPVIGALAEMWLTANLLLGFGSLAPTPTVDGGQLLRRAVWQATGEEALGDEAVQQAGFAAVGGALLAAPVFLLRGKLFVAGGLVAFAAAVTADLLFVRGLKT